YDDEHTLQSTGTPLNNETTYGYDAAGWPTSITDAAGQAGGTTYDALGRATTLTDRLGRQIDYTYDNNGTLASVATDAGSASYTRNALGLLVKLQDFNTATWEYTYTPMGRLATHTDPVSNQWTYTYDVQGRLAQIDYPTAGEHLTKTYDAVGHETRWQYSAGPDLQFTYDTLGRMTHANEITLTYNACAEVLNTTNAGADFGATYDTGGRLEKVSYAGQFTVTYTYDQRNQVTRVADDLTNSWMTFIYNDDGALIEINRSNGVKTTFTRDVNGRVTRILDEKSGTVADQQFTLNVEGEVTQVTQDLPLDAAGLLAESNAGYTYNAASQVSSTDYAYDERGRLTQAPEHTFTWDGASRLTNIDGDTLAYNGLGNLTSLTSGGSTTAYAYNYALPITPIVAEKTGGTFDTFYVWSPGGTLLYGIDASGIAAPFFYHFDRLGSTLFLTDDNGAVSDTYVYDPYGMELGRSGTSAQPFTFIGQYGVRRFTDTLYHMQRRTYDAQAGRFLSRDPVGTHVYDPSSLNPYQYAAQDPINLLDPQGEGTWNKDHTVLYTKSGAFVQTEPSHGNYLGGWTYVRGMRQENPPAPDPDPPTKEEQLEEREPPEKPQENPHEAENKATSLSGDNSVQQGATPPPAKPPVTNAGNTASEMNASSSQTSESGSQHISDLAEQAKKVLDTATEGSQAGDLSGLAQFLPGSDMIEMGLNLIDTEKVLYGAAAGLTVENAQAKEVGVDYKLVRNGLSEAGEYLREKNTEEVRNSWQYKWFGPIVGLFQ
ncbi:MAG: RHS repeat-associated core domain-containing protein, partial [Chloroflexota bacterium]|nr:RHS repeat-associated core domain-containing protein [Chloroflexota bacterium]